MAINAVKTAGDGPGFEAYHWDDKTKLTSYVPYEWPVRVTSVRGRRVTLERPLPLDVRPEWDPRPTTLVTPLTGSNVPPASGAHAAIRSSVRPAERRTAEVLP